LTPDEDYDIGHYIRTDILNSAIHWYTGRSQQSQWLIHIYIGFIYNLIKMYLFLLVKFQSNHYPGEAAMDEEDDMDFDGLEDDEDDDDDDESSKRPGMLAGRY
jgi:hypothetical protein